MTSELAENTFVNLTEMEHSLDEGIAGRARLGLIVLASDHTIEAEFHRALAELPGVAAYAARIRNSPTITPETLAAMAAEITATTELILPGSSLDVIAYGCTSASMVIGEAEVAGRIRHARPDARTTNPVTAARAAMAALGLRRIALLTPYIDRINQAMRAYFEGCGLAVAAMGSFGEGDDNRVARVAPESIRQAVLELGGIAGVDGVFVSCTALRLLHLIEELEATLGKPVTSSNQALLWHSLRLAGVEDALPGYGRLLHQPLP
jgi:maleate isomerase